MSDHDRPEKATDGDEDDELEVEGLPEGEPEHPITETGDPIPM